MVILKIYVDFRIYSDSTRFGLHTVLNNKFCTNDFVFIVYSREGGGGLNLNNFIAQVQNRMQHYKQLTILYI